MEWNFYTARGIKQDDKSDSHLTDDALRDPASALVREDTQNRCDARSDKTQPVIIRYDFPADNLTPESTNHWFGQLAPHLTSAKVLEKLLRN